MTRRDLLQGAPWWVLPLLIPSLVLAAIGIAFRLWMWSSPMVRNAVLLVIGGIVLLGVGEYWWGGGMLGFALVALAWAAHESWPARHNWRIWE